MSASYITYGARKLVTVPSNWVYSETLDSVTNSLNYIKVHKAFENSKNEEEFSLILVINLIKFGTLDYKIKFIYKSLSFTFTVKPENLSNESQ